MALKKSRLLLLPLDDRPQTFLFPQRLAEIAGIELLVPPRPLLGKFLVPGDADALAKWLSENAANIDGILAAVDMLAYGGLVASRSMTTPLDQAAERLQVLKRIKEQHPGIKIFAASVIMRISITAADASIEPYYHDIIRYSELQYRVEFEKRAELRGEYESLIKKIPAPVLAEYLSARKRNHEVNRRMVEWFAAGILDKLILLQEDASSVGPHLLEQRELKRLAVDLGVLERLSIYPGADEGTQTLLASWINQSREIPLSIGYTSAEAALQVMPFEDRPLIQTLQNHLAAAGCKMEADAESKYILWLHTPCQREQIHKAVSKIKQLLADGKMVGIADVRFPNGGDDEFMRALAEEKILFKLAAYSAWNTAGNSIGTAVAQMCAWISAYENGCSNFQMKTQGEFLWERYIDDWGYQRIVREIVETRLRNSGLDPLNLGQNKELAEQLVVSELTHWLGNTFDRHEEDVKLPQVSICLPWPRTFEVEVKCS
jgi:hypothetical protein